MAQQGSADPGTAVEKSAPPSSSPGTAVVTSDRVENPGFPPFRARVSDLDPAKERQNERRVSWLFIASIVGSVFSIVAYIAFPIDPSDPGSVRLNNLLLGLGIDASPCSGSASERCTGRSRSWTATTWSSCATPPAASRETRERAVEIFTLGNQESGFTRRKLIRNTLIGALVRHSRCPPIVLFRDLAPGRRPGDGLQAHHVGRRASA